MEYVPFSSTSKQQVKTPLSETSKLSHTTPINNPEDIKRIVDKFPPYIKERIETLKRQYEYSIGGSPFTEGYSKGDESLLEEAKELFLTWAAIIEEEEKGKRKLW